MRLVQPTFRKSRKVGSLESPLRSMKNQWQTSPAPLLPTPGLQHLRLVQPSYRQAFHRSSQIFTDFK